MFCSDDKHPDSLVVGHVNLLVKRALEAKKNLFAVLRAASINAIHHYNLPIGQARVGDNADFILVKDFETMECLATYKAGELLAKNGESHLTYIPETPINAFVSRQLDIAEIRVQTSSDHSKVQVKCIEALNGQLITNSIISTLPVKDGIVQCDPSQDVLKMVCINRYSHSKPAIAYIKNFGLQSGAIGSTVAHDSHNIIVVGVDDEAILTSINQLMHTQGGINVVHENQVQALPLPLAGLMSVEPAEIVAKNYAHLDKEAKQLGSKLDAPFMTLSFMALLVIPHLKLSDLGLFDGDSFNFTNLIISE
jgi:adenine deaminase